MKKDTELVSRKSDHIKINLEQDVRSALATGLENYRFVHEALPELDLERVAPSLSLFGKRLAAPILISSMTGGTEEAETINLRLAEAAQEAGVAMGVGSQRAALEHPEQAATFQVRRVAPGILLFANLGAVQLNNGYTLDHCRRAVDMIQADALILHLNPLQEAVQVGGNVNFAGLAKVIAETCKKIEVPVIAKEVGWGISERTAKLLADCGVSAIDVAGAGGTSWSQVEMHRAPTARHARVAGAFIDWGIPTADSLRYCREAAPGLPIFASGGIKDGIEAAKCIALGASLAGLAGEFLRAADRDGAAGVVELAATITDELRVAMFCAGAADLAALAQTPLHTRF